MIRQPVVWARTPFVSATVVLALLVAVLVVILGAVPLGAQEGRGRSLGAPPTDDLSKLVRGCLGVTQVESKAGPNYVLAWFEDRAAVIRWYRSQFHRGVMQRFAAAHELALREPLEHVADEAGPILVIAKITPKDESERRPGELPIAQVSMELYTPLPGGMGFGGRLAPEGVALENFRVVPLPTEAMESDEDVRAGDTGGEDGG